MHCHRKGKQEEDSEENPGSKTEKQKFNAMPPLLDATIIDVDDIYAAAASTTTNSALNVASSTTRRSY